jgi:hypothetical protein
MPGRSIRLATLFVGALLLASASMAAEDGASAEQASWRHTKQTMTFFGFTSAYTCDGIEGKVREILLMFGARKDAKVSATGCSGTAGINAPSRSAWVRVEFDALAPGPGAGGAEAVEGQWAPIEVTAHRPFDMKEGDCEIVEHLRGVIMQGFAFKDLEYETRCVPHQQTIGSYSIKGKVLRPATPATSP